MLEINEIYNFVLFNDDQTENIGIELNSKSLYRLTLKSDNDNIYSGIQILSQNGHGEEHEFKKIDRLLLTGYNQTYIKISNLKNTEDDNSMKNMSIIIKEIKICETEELTMEDSTILIHTFRAFIAILLLGLIVVLGCAVGAKRHYGAANKSESNSVLVKDDQKVEVDAM